jgi:glycosyltransferase
MKVSIITPVLNGQETLEATIGSILCQGHKDIEYIIVDNGSTDGTLDIINKYRNRIAKVLFESERGIYTTMNTGLKNAEGEIIGILNSDDIYANDKVIETVVSQMTEHNTRSCYGDLLYVNKNNMSRTIRHWKSRPYHKHLLKRGWMPPHPTFFVKKEVYDKYGIFDTDFKIAADYELMLRFLEKNKITSHYIPDVLVKMRVGGISNRQESKKYNEKNR